MNSASKNTFLRSIAPNRGEIKSLLEELELFLEIRAVSSELRQKVVICAGELLHNALEHGVFNLVDKELLLAQEEYDNKLRELEQRPTNEQICFELREHNSSLEFSVECSGKPFSVQQGGVKELSGRGLQIAQGFCDQLTIAADRNLVSARIKR